LVDSSLLTVHQMFSGELSGDMMLLFEAKSAPKLVKLFNRGLTQKLTDEENLKSDNVDELAELGNILLGAFAGAFGNLLHIQIRFAVPALHKVSLLSMLDSLKVGKEELRYAVVVRIFFRLVEDDIESRMLIVMGVASLEALLRAIESEGFLATSN
jgi:chemotaxis protein CheC